MHLLPWSLKLKDESVSRPPQEAFMPFPFFCIHCRPHKFFQLIFPFDHVTAIRMIFYFKLWKCFRPWSCSTFIRERRYKNTFISGRRQVCRYDVRFFFPIPIEIDAKLFSFHLQTLFIRMEVFWAFLGWAKRTIIDSTFLLIWTRFGRL